MAGPAAVFDKFGGAGTAKGVLLSVSKPETARDQSVVSQIRACSGFFFVGGVQSRVIKTFRPDGKSSPAYADQHFLSRGRFGRLLVALLELDQFDLAFGIDENTALVVDGGMVWAAGASGVIVMDERGAHRDGRGASGVRFHMMSSGDRFDLASRAITIAAEKRALPSAMGDSASVSAPKDVFARWEFLHLLEHFARSPQTSLAVPVNGGGQITISFDLRRELRRVAGRGAVVSMRREMMHEDPLSARGPATRNRSKPGLAAAQSGQPASALAGDQCLEGLVQQCRALLEPA